MVFGAEIPCGKCESCKKFKGETNLCNNPISVGSNFNGGFSNYFVISKKIFSKIPHITYTASKPLKYACLAESLACVINGIEVSNLKKNHKIAIIGSGYMGLLFVGMAKIIKASTISIIDYDSKRLEIAKSLGANNIIKLKKKDSVKFNKILEPTNQQGYDVVISANSNPTSHEIACNIIGKNGTVNLFGGIPKNFSKYVKIDSNSIHYKQAKITGSFSSNKRHLKKAFKIIKNNSIDFSKIVTSYANYKNFKNKIKLLNKRKEIKSIFRPV